MDDREFRKLLEQLHAEIGRTGIVDEKGRDLLRRLDADIRDLLEYAQSQSDPNRVQPNELTLSGLEEAIHYFEVDHPILTGQLSRLMEILSNAGI